MDREVEGLQVLVDLHGGDSIDPSTISEFIEIRDKVRQEVILPGDFLFAPLINASVNLESIVLIR